MSDAQPLSLETVKASSSGLRGSLGGEIRSVEPAFSAASAQLLKFHGVYQQDDRDSRAERARRREPVDHICMVRLAIPGGMLSAEQYLAIDALCARYSGSNLRVTTRQDLQLHFVTKDELPDLVNALNSSGMTTFAACGDVVRNTVCCPAPLPGRDRLDVQALAAEIAATFKPSTPAYSELWVDGGLVASATGPDEPIYGATYLPRKFKIGISYPGDNCVEIHANDLGVVPLVDGDGCLRGHTILVGGGMGRSHKDPGSFAMLAIPLTTVLPDQLMAVIEAIVWVHREYGDRVRRDRARLKYLVATWGIERFRSVVAARMGVDLPPAEPVDLEAADDHLGWHEQFDGGVFLGLKTPSGRLVDTEKSRLRSVLRLLVERYASGVRFTSREDVLVTGIDPRSRPEIDLILEDHGIVQPAKLPPTQRNGFACPALPTCGLALTESERVFADVLDEIEELVVNLGLSDLDLNVRMTGCPNGCARPYTSDVGLVGRGKGRYDIHIGGHPTRSRLNELFIENVPRTEIVDALLPVMSAFAKERSLAESFSEYCARTGIAMLRARYGTDKWLRTTRSNGARQGGDR